MSVQNAIQLNNQAVFFLEHKLLFNAVRYSCAAMDMFQKHHRTVNQASPQAGDDPIDQLMIDHCNENSSDDTNDEFIYKHGIALPTNTVDTNAITPVLIFNCALCHQLLAKQHNDAAASDTYLDRAKRLYRIALDQQARDANAIFKFALANNIGVIHKKLGEHEESNQYFRQLESLMMIYVDFGVENKRLQYIQGFWKNVMGNTSIAPAA